MSDAGETFYVVVNPAAKTRDRPVAFAREGPDDAVYRTPEDAHDARERLAAKYGHDAFEVKKMNLAPAPDSGAGGGS